MGRERFVIVGPHPAFDAMVAIVVGLMLGAMALFLAAINRRLLIDTADATLDRAATEFLAARGVPAEVRSIVLDANSSVVFVRVEPGHWAGHDTESYALGQALKAHAQALLGKTIDAVYWKFPRRGPEA